MKNLTLNYETLIKITRSLSRSKDPDKIIQMTVKSIQSTLGLKGCALFLVNQKTNELDVAASVGLSEEYLNKGTVSALQSIADSLKDGPVAVYDVSDDPRIQYPEEAKREGIASVLSVPMTVKGRILGVLRIYTSEQRYFSDDEHKLICGLADIAGLAIDNARMYDHLKNDHKKLIHDVHQWFEFGKTS